MRYLLLHLSLILMSKHDTTKEAVMHGCQISPSEETLFGLENLDTQQNEAGSAWKGETAERKSMSAASKKSWYRQKCVNAIGLRQMYG